MYNYSRALQIITGFNLSFTQKSNQPIVAELSEAENIKKVTENLEKAEGIDNNVRLLNLILSSFFNKNTHCSSKHWSAAIQKSKTRH